MFKRSMNYNTHKCIRSLLGGSKLSFYARLHNNRKELNNFFQILCLKVAGFRNHKIKELFSKGTTYSTPGHQPWEELLRELIAAQIPLHETGHRRLTLLQRILSDSVFQTGINHSERQIFDWAKILQASGIDLEQYGNKKRSIFQRVDTWNFGGSEKSVITYELGLSSLVGFNYDSCVEDWNFWFSEPTDQFAGDFWSLIEDPPLMNFVPGAWIDESPYAYSGMFQARTLDGHLRLN
ncbi:hypothetical protein BCON_0240g00060 [Botryotinia convoluta]|uniref:Uncharacterized protein n=1 Tax=Botryotinia convoluta TaxID=54673 RepID=A0A4Z1HUK6_9HELO|nr:hypothetical protein BCON_0240g00060 [Botryotinia convoluta]